jgi:hypothetical protein
MAASEDDLRAALEQRFKPPTKPLCSRQAPQTQRSNESFPPSSETSIIARNNCLQREAYVKVRSVRARTGAATTGSRRERPSTLPSRAYYASSRQSRPNPSRSAALPRFMLIAKVVQPIRLKCAAGVSRPAHHYHQPILRPVQAAVVSAITTRA